MVRIPYRRSSLVVAGPAYKRSDTTKGQTMSFQPSTGITVVASGLRISLPSLANTLLKETPTEMVIPNSSFTRRRRASAICSPSPNSPVEPVTSSQHSSRPKGSTRSV